MKRIFSLCLVLLSFVPQVLAADDFMRSTGKIGVVVGVLVVIFLGLLYYLFTLDRKLTKLENQINNDGQES